MFELSPSGGGWNFAVIYSFTGQLVQGTPPGPFDTLSIDGSGNSLGQALSTADSRVRQISDYAARHRESVGAEAQNRLEEAKRHLAAAHGREGTNEAEAIAYANRASTLAAQAQTSANADVLAAHRTPRRRGTASTR